MFQQYDGSNHTHKLLTSSNFKDPLPYMGNVQKFKALFPTVLLRNEAAAVRCSRSVT